MATWVSAYFLKYGTLMQLIALVCAQGLPEASERRQLHTLMQLIALVCARGLPEASERRQLHQVRYPDATDCTGLCPRSSRSQWAQAAASGTVP